MASAAPVDPLATGTGACHSSTISLVLYVECSGVYQHVSHDRLLHTMVQTEPIVKWASLQRCCSVLA